MCVEFSLKALLIIQVVSADECPSLNKTQCRYTDLRAQSCECDGHTKHRGV